MNRRDERKAHFLLNTATAAVIAALAALLIKFLLGWILPFVVGFLIAAAVQPAAAFAHRHWHMPKRAAGLLFAVLLILGLLGICAVILTRLVLSFTPFVRQLPAFFTAVAGRTDESLRHLSQTALKGSPEMARDLAGLVDHLSLELSKASNYAGHLLTLAGQVLSGLPDVLFGIAVTILSACLFSMDYERIRAFLFRQFSRGAGETLCDSKRYFFDSVGKMIRAYAFLMLLTFAELSIGLTLLRIPNAVLVAFLIALVDILPILGTGTVMVPWAVIVLLCGDIPLAAGLAALYAVITTVRTFLEPKVVGAHIGLYPLVTLVAIFFGFKFAGVAGMFLFPLLILLVKRLNDTGRIRLWK